MCIDLDDSDGDHVHCGVWLREAGGDMEEWCCQSCYLCPDGCEDFISFDCTNHADVFGDVALECSGCPNDTVGGGEGKSQCDVGGINTYCSDAAEDGSVQFCIDVDDDDDPTECAFWIRQEGDEENYCCRTCSLCGLDCEFGINYDCSNHDDVFFREGGLEADCGVCTVSFSFFGGGEGYGGSLTRQQRGRALQGGGKMANLCPAKKKRRKRDAIARMGTPPPHHSPNFRT